MGKPVEEQIQDFLNLFKISKEYYAALDEYKAGKIKRDELRKYWGMELHNWHYDPDWDGVLIENVRKMAAAGFDISKFYRKRKIEFKIPKDMTRDEVVKKLCETVGYDWVGISFTKRGGSIWWRGGAPWKSYRGY